MLPGAAGLLPARVAAAQGFGPDSAPDRPLAEIAASRGLTYGMAAKASQLTEQPALAALRRVLTCGLSERWSWLACEPAVALPPGDGHCDLPWDREGNRKAMWRALARAFLGQGPG